MVVGVVVGGVAVDVGGGSSGGRLVLLVVSTEEVVGALVLLFVLVCVRALRLKRSL